MRLVKPGLFVGTREEANEVENLKKHNINRVLTVDSQVLLSEEEHITRLHVNCLDEPTSDLLTSFDRCIQFIEEGLANNESVLVHCLSGVSRSITVVLAYLMKIENLPLDKALFRLENVYLPDKINPNPGFLEQLRLYEEMGNTVDESSTIFKQYKLKLLTSQIKENGDADNNLKSRFLKEVNSRNTPTSVDQKYKCKKCRMTLFHSSNIIKHETSQGLHLFTWHKRKDDLLKATNNIDCTSVFIEPIDWMSLTLLGSVEGKLLCPKCKCRLGSFNWSGMQCSCASWVTPAFQFHKNKIDNVLENI